MRKFRLGALALIGAEMLAISATALSGASRTPERNAPAVARTAKESVLYSFSGTDGEYPTADVIQGSDGNFYGTTSEGGPNFNPAYYTYGGTVFRLTPSGTLTTLYSFCSLPGCADGEEPQAGVIQGSDGNFYGTTFSGGEHGMGTVFKLTPSGTLTTLYSFCTQLDCTDGSQPYAGVIQGSDGNLYGTTESGGKYGPYYAGTVFKLTPSGTLTTLHSFTGGADGGNPYAGLIQGSDGNFYGTTAYGGRYQDGGTVFQLTPSGTLTTLYPFCTQPDCTDGMYPRAGVIQGSDGNFYGTTFSGGNGPDSNGTVFKLTPSGKLTTLYWFCKKSDCTDGNSPYGGVIQGSDGNFYGTTRWGGANHNANAGVGGGTLFKLTPSGALTILYSFCSQPGCTDGLDPYAGVIKRSDGNFYGTTYYGGAYGAGTVFQLSPSTPTPTATPTATVTMTATPPSTPTDTPTKTPTATQTPTSTARLRASPDKISFGRVDATGVSKARKVTVINASKSASAVIGTISPTVTSFAIVAGSDLCSGQTLAPKNTCTFELNFQPSTPGAVSDMLAIPFNGSPEPQISLKGTGVRVVLKGPKSENLGTAVWGSSGKVKNLSIRNPGSVSVILGIPALGGIDAGSFTIPGLLNSRLNICSGQTLAPKGKCEIPLEFTPPNWHPIGARGEQFGRLSVPYTYGRNSGTYSAALSGTVK